MNLKTLAVRVGALAMVALTAQAVGSSDYTLFGGASYVQPGNASFRAVQLLADISNADPSDDFSGVDFAVSPTLKFSDLQTLSTDYEFTRGSCAGGSPRFQINVFDPISSSVKNIFVYIGPPPSYTGCPANVWANTGNLLTPASLIDTTQLTAGAFYDPVTSAQVKYGSYQVVGIQIVADTFGAPQTVLIDNVLINSILYTFEPDAGVGSFQVDYLPAAGTGIAGGYIDISNAGALGADAFGPLAGTTGRICVNVYTFTADEQESECCSCLVTPNALVHLTAGDLVGNPGNGVTPTLGLVVKLLATIPGPGINAQGTFTGSACNAAQTFTPANLAPGLVAWSTKFHANPTAVPGTVLSLTETPFSKQALSPGELTKLTNLCQFLSGNQSGAGLCKACSLGGLGAGKR